ncbi:MAG TPA: hypothetical protein VJ725_17695, partial [Thermoanaerobaculia bacterium]|nr:hypothetical protein [Thermoanaerobaculia bacterium]
PPPVEVDPAAEQARGQYAELMRQGHAAARAGDYQNAATLYAEAEQIAPEEEKAQIRELRLGVEKLASEMPGMIEQEKQVSAKIEEARKALDAGRFDVALAAANAVLAMDQKNEDAREILAKVQEGLARSGSRVTQPPSGETKPGNETVAGTTPVQGTTPETSGQPREGTVTEKPMLHVDLDSRFFAGSVIVRLDRQEVRRIPFDFSSGGGFLRGRKKGSGTLRQDIPMPSGYHRLSIQVNPRNKPAEVEDFDVNFEDGPKTVSIQISESGQVTVDLR